MNRFGRTVSWAGMLVALASAWPAQSNISFTNYWDASVTAAQQTTILNAENFYTTNFSNNVDISIEFATVAGGGGSSQASTYVGPTFRVKWGLNADSTANPLNTDLSSALPNFWNGNVGVRSLTQMTAPNGRILGFSTNGYTASIGSVRNVKNLDGIVRIGAGAYGSTAVIMHEINEVMGSGGWSTTLGDPIRNYTRLFGLLGPTYGMLDPYRYNGANSPSFQQGVAAYLSTDNGVTNIASYNSGMRGDAGDLATNPCLVQSWQVCGALAQPESLASPDGAMLQIIGYDPVPPAPPPPPPPEPGPVVPGDAVPEANAWLLMVVGVAGLGLAMRARRRTAAL